MTLSLQQWQQASALFDRLATAPARERESILSDEAVAPDVRLWLKELLEAHDSNQTVLIDRQIDQLIDQVQPISSALHQPEQFFKRHFGPWQAHDEIGRGGMGLVLNGQRADGAFEKQVAIKLLDPARVGRERQRQLRKELQLLARLSHPSIAQVLDGGVAEDGVPYLVMEYVDGLPINQYCKQYELKIDARLDLFYRVAEAVSYCHRQLVVHGDIKPDNVLVAGDDNRDGQVKLLDFGIASRLSGNTDSDNGRIGLQRWCSPAYAAPERLAGAAASVAEDVYSLAALLYELLTDGRIRSAADLTQLVVGKDHVFKPMAASEMAVQRGRPELANTLRGDLDRILAHALADKPDQRYASVEALVEDLQRWQADRPIAIRPISTRYRVEKWLQRNRLLAASLSAFLLALLTGLAVSVWQADRAEQAAEAALMAQQKAETEGQRADTINRFLLDLFEAQIPELPPDQLPSTAQIINEGIERSRNPETGSPELRAELLLSLSRILVARLQFEQSDPLLDEVGQWLNSQSDSQPKLAMQHAALRAETALMRDQLEAAEQHFERAIALHDKYEAGSMQHHRLRRRLARVWMQLEQWQKAEEYLLEINSELSGKSEYEDFALSVAGDLAATAGALNRTAAAQQRFQQILDMKTRLQHSPQSLATTEVNLAIGSRTLGQYAAAEQYYRNVLNRLEPYTEVPRPVRATAYKGLSDLARMRGYFDQAEQQLVKAAEEWALIMNIQNMDDDFYLAYHRAHIHGAAQRYSEAAAELNQALSLMMSGSGAPSHRIGQAQADLIGYQCLAGNEEQNERSLDTVMALESEMVQRAVNEARAQCALAGNEAELNLDWVSPERIEYAMDRSADASRVALLMLLRAELLIGNDRSSDAALLLDAAETQLTKAEAVDSHPLWQSHTELKTHISDERK